MPDATPDKSNTAPPHPNSHPHAFRAAHSSPPPPTSPQASATQYSPTPTDHSYPDHTTPPPQPSHKPPPYSHTSSPTPHPPAPPQSPPAKPQALPGGG